MARVTVDDCIKRIPNRFQLTLAATYRARQITMGSMLADSILQESIKSVRVWGYQRAAGKPLIALANGEPLLLEQKVGAGKVMLLTTGADRDWSDLPVKTVFLPLIQSLTQYLAGGKRGNLDAGIVVGAVKELTFPATFVGRNLRVTKPDKQNTEVAFAGANERAAATVDDNDQAGIYRLSLRPGATKTAAHHKSTPSTRRFWSRVWTKSAPPSSPAS